MLEESGTLEMQEPLRGKAKKDKVKKYKAKKDKVKMAEKEEIDLF